MRNIFIVNATIVDSTGAFNTLSGYPMTFDSRSYSDDVSKARKRADGAFAECWGAMCKRDDRMIQTVTLTSVYGELLDRKSTGNFPVPNPEEPEETPAE